jgi:hypothetical protein
MAGSYDLDVDKKSHPGLAWDIQQCFAELHVAPGAPK